MVATLKSAAALGLYYGIAFGFGAFSFMVTFILLVFFVVILQSFIKSLNKLLSKKD